MKKRIATIMSIALVMGMTACGKIPKIPHITSKTEQESESTEVQPVETEPSEDPSEATTSESSEAPTPTEKPEQKSTPTPTPKATEPSETDPSVTEPDPVEIHEPVVIITSDDENTDEYATCSVTHVKQGRSWRYEGLTDILTFSDDLITIDIPAYASAADIINETLEFMNKEAEDKFRELTETLEVPPYPQEPDDEDEEGRKKNDDKKPEATWTTVTYTQTAEVVLCKENVIGIRYSYIFSDADGIVTETSEYLMFDLRTGDYISVEDLARSSGLFGDHLYYMALELLPVAYPLADIDEDTFAKELVKVKNSYDWEIVDRDGTAVLRFWYPADAFSVLRLEDVVFEADFEQFSMYLTSYCRSILA